MTFYDLFKMFGISAFFVTMGVSLRAFPRKYPDSNYHAPNDISRYISVNGITPAFFEGFSKKRWDYIQIIAPKTFIVTGILDACMSVLLYVCFPSWDKSFVFTIRTLFIIAASFLYIGYKSKRYK